MDYYDLPLLNASLNATSTVLLLAAYTSIRRGNEALHKKLMLSATLVGAAFLTSYLIYHNEVGSIRFTTEGWPRRIYLTILVPHVILATAMVPMLLITLRFALRGERERHRRIARWTFPTWLFVSVTGVLVYLMLYHWYPSTQIPG